MSALIFLAGVALGAGVVFVAAAVCAAALDRSLA